MDDFLARLKTRTEAMMVGDPPIRPPMSAR
jgi:hypothetical protein